jgi:nucleoid-associated protein YgaU
VVLPYGARRGAALALGIGLGVTGPVLGSTLMVLTAPAAAADTVLPDRPALLPGAGAIPDWPTDTGTLPGQVVGPSAAPALPDWPPSPAVGDHVVVRGDCLWDIAAARLADQLGRTASAPEIARATAAWWAANAAVIGSDPDVLFPGQVLRPPAR